MTQLIDNCRQTEEIVNKNFQTCRINKTILRVPCISVFFVITKQKTLNCVFRKNTLIACKLPP